MNKATWSLVQWSISLMACCALTLLGIGKLGDPSSTVPIDPTDVRKAVGLFAGAFLLAVLSLIHAVRHVAEEIKEVITRDPG